MRDFSALYFPPLGAMWKVHSSPNFSDMLSSKHMAKELTILHLVPQKKKKKDESLQKK